MDFLLLPAEIRLEIYTLVLTDIKSTTLRVAWSLQFRAKMDAMSKQKYTYLTTKIDTALLRVCRTIFQESTPIFCGHHSFRLSAKQAVNRHYAYLPLMRRLSLSYISVNTSITPEKHEMSELGDNMHYIMRYCPYLQEFALSASIQFHDQDGPLGNIPSSLGLPALYAIFEHLSFLPDGFHPKLVDLRKCLTKDNCFHTRMVLKWRRDKGEDSIKWTLTPNKLR